jgi:hypothetical protein
MTADQIVDTLTTLDTAMRQRPQQLAHAVQTSGCTQAGCACCRRSK